MRSATPRRPSARLALLAALAGGVSATQPLRAVEAAPTSPAGSAPSASPPASAGAPGNHAVPVSAYAWPTEPTAEPKEEEWAGATDLELEADHHPGDASTWCSQQVLGTWLRITCAPPSHVGVIWGLAGDVAKVKGKFALVSEVAHDNRPPKSVQEDLERRMGASATITLPITPGSALLLRVDRIAWDEEYDWSGVVSSAGVLIDVSWALGEKHPTILYH